MARIGFTTIVNHRMRRMMTMNDDSWVSKPVKAGFSIEIVIVVVVEDYEVVLGMESHR
jgi:hypothetical protein